MKFDERNINIHTASHCSSYFERRRCANTRPRLNGGRFLWNPCIALVLASILGVSHGIKVCQLEQCVPDCICDYQYDDMCAMEYGNYGWRVPPTTGDYIWRHMKPETPISRAEIKPAGRADESHRMTGLGFGNGKVLTVAENGVLGQVFFEVHPRHMESNEMIVELFGGINGILLGEDCEQSGTLLGQTKFGQTLPNEVGFSAKIIPYPSYNDNFFDSFMECHPRFTGAVMGAATFEFSNAFSGDDFWYPQPPDQGNVGTLRYCVRVRIQPQGVPPKMPGTFIDTKFEIKGDRSGSSFGDQSNIRIYTEQEWDSKKAHIERVSVSVDAFLCGLPPSANEVDDQHQATILADGITISAKAKSFGIGDEFTICVSPSSKASNDYEVIGFHEIICENDGQSRTIVEDGTPDMLTIIDRSTIGHIDLTEKAKTGIVKTIMEPGTLAFRTKVTTGWLQMNERTIECTGIAEIAKRKNPLNNRYRQLLRRDLQLVERQERGSVADFSIYVDVNNSTTYNPDKKNSGDCVSCRRTFLSLAILLALFGILGGSGYWWWATYGCDWLYRKRKDYNTCASQSKLEEIAVSDNDDDHHHNRQRITKPFMDATSSSVYDDFTDESKRWRAQ